MLKSSHRAVDMSAATAAKTSEQAAARAFAAESLAPSTRLSRLLSADPDPEEIDRLAKRYQVSSRVVEYQVENHDLAELAVA